MSAAASVNAFTGDRSAMTLPNNDLTTFELIFAAGRAVFLVFSFVVAAVTFTA